MPGLEPGIHAIAAYRLYHEPEGVDHRVEPGDDDRKPTLSRIPLGREACRKVPRALRGA